MQDFIQKIDSTTIAAIIGAFGALLVAVITFISTLVISHFTKKQRLGIEVKSKHRQDWINALRKDISLICTKSNYITYDIREILRIEHIQNQDNKKTFSEYIYEYGAINSSYFNVKLFLNPKEDKHIKLDNEINNLKENLMSFINENLKPDNQLSEDNTLKNRTKIEKNIDEITSLSQSIFKEEWERIKKGN
ncbi:hypothetical protein ACU7RR_002335 [Providencia stuartii]|uniref:Uncharacterized protein n=1 Tax=Providencia stuartii (strain MRSN 2154) TaxID=1157951 RepID=A0A140NGC4_PROSM|nr:MULTISPECIES: hypothetical protein [Providencia]AFH91931.1 hypothetical protein S70_00140 [Providencia stuartii MRSN 2154]MDE8744682.1 hypothetical protein [Providencia thailandensis]MDE8765902.1 hypothetical protein [Providencia thailandensis]MDE8778364.1 hypothetical protein [Providencia thailandensis]MDE8782620.1 hypothetical protein [Providencia thailandensis]